MTPKKPKRWTARNARRPRAPAGAVQTTGNGNNGPRRSPGLHSSSRNLCFDLLVLLLGLVYLCLRLSEFRLERSGPFAASGFGCEIRTHTKGQPLSPCFRCHDTLGQERRKRHQNSTRNATSKRQTLFALSSSLSSASPRSKVLSASALQDICLTQNFLSVSASRFDCSPACNEQVACPKNGGTDLALACGSSALHAIYNHIEHPTLERATALSQARSVCVARLKLLGNTSNTVQSAGLIARAGATGAVLGVSSRALEPHEALADTPRTVPIAPARAQPCRMLLEACSSS